MQLEEYIFKRQSCRDYKETKLSEETLNSIKLFIESTKKLDNSIRTDYAIVEKDMIKTVLPWRSPYYIALFSEEKDNYLENIGFIFQQLDLYLHSINLASCWLGLASLNSRYTGKHDLKEIIVIAFGEAKHSNTRSIEDFKRKSLAEISDIADEKLKPAQYAPSAVNGQPWYFEHRTDGTISVYSKKQNFIKRKILGNTNRIDVGIALAHLYVAYTDDFTFDPDGEHSIIKGYEYIGNCTLG